MISYSSILGYPMAINAPILTDKLKGELGFDGFIISDYDELSKIAEQGLPTQRFNMHRDDAVCYIINAGIDMMMLPVYIEGIIEMY
jgi:beta-glucosidase